MRKYAAAVTGAIEGFVEALDEYHVQDDAKEAVHETGEVARAATQEFRNQAQTPEMQQVKQGAQAVGQRARGATDSMKTSAGHMRDSMSHRAESMQQSMHETADRVRHTAQVAKEETKVRGQAIAESGRRAKQAPGHIRHELSAAVSAWMKGLATAIAMWAALGLVGATAFIVLTIALVTGLNELIGDPAGTFVVAVLYLVVAGIAYGAARRARASASEKTHEHVENSKEEVRHVTGPLRDAFSTRRRTNI